MNKHHSTESLIVYVGFLDGRPHIELASGSGGSRVLTGYVSQTAAKRAYQDVRKARLIFDADWEKQEHKAHG
jgi:hypothetical protein